MWSANGDKRIQSIDSIETYSYETSKDLVSKKEEIKFNMYQYLCHNLGYKKYKLFAVTEFILVLSRFRLIQQSLVIKKCLRYRLRGLIQSRVIPIDLKTLR